MLTRTDVLGTSSYDPRRGCGVQPPQCRAEYSRHKPLVNGPGRANGSEDVDHECNRKEQDTPNRHETIDADVT